MTILRGAALALELERTPPRERDAFVDDLLGIEPPPADAPLPRGAVPYLPCSADAVLAMVRLAPLAADHAFVDLGSGLGRVVMLAHLLTGARAVGVEIQEHLVHASRERAAALGLADVSFVHANAADVELDGSVFFLYAPFNGELLQRVLARVERAAHRRAIVVCAVDVELEVPWLVRRASSTLALAMYDSVRPA